MAEINKAPRGTCDVLGTDSLKWQYVEKTMLDTAALYGFKEGRGVFADRGFSEPS